jgi:PAS domain S-box-containing protein
MGVDIKVLVIEDETIVAADLKDKLGHLGYGVIGTARTGEEAVRIATGERPTLVLMDIVLAGEMDGIEAADRIRRICNIPIIFLTAHSDSETLARARATGPFGYLLKPFNERELETHIEMALYRYNIEEKLREKEERLRLAIDATRMALWDWNVVSNQATWAGHYGELFGRNPDAFQDTYEGFLALVHEHDRDQVGIAMQRALKEGTPYASEFRVRWPNQSIHWLEWWGEVFRDEQKQPIRMIGMLQDITRSREVEDALRGLTGELEQRVADRTEELVRSESRLRALSKERNLTEQRERRRLATELHDYLAQLLVLGKIKLGQAKQGGLSASSADFVVETEGIIAQALTYTRSLVGQLCPPVLKEFGLAIALKWLADQMQQHGLNVTLHTKEERLPLSDEQEVLLFQSVRELLMNTVKHAEAESATINLDRSDNLIRLVVEDQGRGFDVTTISADLSTQFGLFSINERMRALDGQFVLASEPGRGTTATLILPLAERAGASAPLASETHVPSAAHSDQEPVTLNGSGPTIQHVSDVQHLQDASSENVKIRVLLVDDHAMIRAGLKAMLLEYPTIDIVGEAVHGADAVSLVRSLQPEVVVMDVTMPVMDGIEATHLIKQQFPDVIVIGLSVHSAVQVMTSMKEAGAAAVLTKETAAETLHRTIYDAWEAQSARLPTHEVSKNADSMSCRPTTHDGGVRSPSPLN